MTGTKEAAAVQPPFNEMGELPAIIYGFSEGGIIYPDHGGEGVVQHPFQAEKLKGKKCRGLSAFKVLPGQNAPLYYNCRHFFLGSGERFGAYSKIAQKIHTSVSLQE